jgi:hypothetical protein
MSLIARSTDEGSSLRFDERKTVQAAAKFARLAGDRINYMKLIKLLYLLDRSALRRWGRPVTRGEYWELKLGPIVSEVDDLITEPPSPNEDHLWPKFFSAPSDYLITLTADPGDDDLSEMEDQLIGEINEKFGGYDPFELVDRLHKMLGEVQGLVAGRRRITIDEILRAETKIERLEAPRSAEEAQAIERELDRVHAVEKLLAI